MDAKVDATGGGNGPPLSADLLRGADAIAEYIFGDRKHRRKVYHLAETTKLPVFRLGALLCARRRVLEEWISEQERRNWNPPRRDEPSKTQQAENDDEDEPRS